MAFENIFLKTAKVKSDSGIIIFCEFRSICINCITNIPFIPKFINVVMVDGKKSVAESIVYGALDTVSEKYKEYITPAKMSLGVSSANGYLSQALNQDILGFQSLFKNMMNVIRYRSIDFRM